MNDTILSGTASFSKYGTENKGDTQSPHTKFHLTDSAYKSPQMAVKQDFLPQSDVSSFSSPLVTSIATNGSARRSACSLSSDMSAMADLPVKSPQMVTKQQFLP